MCFAIEWFWVGIEGDKAKVNSFYKKYSKLNCVCVVPQYSFESFH